MSNIAKSITERTSIFFVLHTIPMIQAKKTQTRSRRLEALSIPLALHQTLLTVFEMY